VVNAIGPVEADAAGGNADVMVEAGEVGPAAKVAERQRGCVASLALQPKPATQLPCACIDCG